MRRSEKISYFLINVAKPVEILRKFQVLSRHFFQCEFVFFYKKNKCKKFQKICKEKFRITVAQVFRKNPSSNKISKKFQKILKTDILKNCRK